MTYTDFQIIFWNFSGSNIDSFVIYPINSLLRGHTHLKIDFFLLHFPKEKLFKSKSLKFY